MTGEPSPVPVGTLDQSRRRSSRWRRRLLRLVAVLAVVLLALWLAAAWYFSDVLYDDGLAITPPPEVPVADVAVAAVADDSITLVPGEERPDEVSAPGTWGLWWPDGYGLLTEIEGTSAEAVTRTFAVVDGTAPAVGTLTDVDKYVFGDTPGELLGLEWDDVEITTPLGAQDAWYVPPGGDVGSAGAPTTPGLPAADEVRSAGADDAGSPRAGDVGSASAHDPWAILVHGKGSGRDEMLRMLRTVHEAGFSALVITYRGDRDQPVDPAGVYRFGATEWEDLDAAVDYALDRGATEIVLAGASTGAALIGSWFDNAAETQVAEGIVLDSPNADVERTFAYGASRRTIPGTGWPLPPGLAWTAFRLAELRFPLDFSAVDYSDTLEEVDVPTLVFHGVGDPTVPVEAARDLAAARDAAGVPTTYLETGAAQHVGSYNHDPDRYEKALEEFLRGVG